MDIKNKTKHPYSLVLSAVSAVVWKKKKHKVSSLTTHGAYLIRENGGQIEIHFVFHRKLLGVAKSFVAIFI